MTNTSITVFRIALFVSLGAITLLAVIPLDDSTVTGINDKVGHVLAFYFLALLADFSFPETSLNHSKIVPLLFYGFTIECIQYHIPYREFSLLDFAADIAGIVFYGLSVPGLKFIPLIRFRWNFDKY